MGFFKGMAEGFGCAGRGCGWIIGILVFLILLGVVCTGTCGAIGS
ncbi:MAG TPA: hypothetical protein PLY68_03240 [Myxococcota bacterium]|nr:hypothetical protein [Myxococcota bacterium]HOD08558.1 hypothetical protein [Myxococcota bacterium]HPB50128.1 hypothetical protein [Myxococcota bacterium]HQP95195.1 hypothetical protein [Myxococcota bacterium]